MPRYCEGLRVGSKGYVKRLGPIFDEYNFAK